MTTRCWLVMAVALMPGVSQAQTPATDRDQIIATVQMFFDSMEKRDPELAKRALMADGRTYSVSERDGVTAVRGSTVESFITSLAGGQGQSLERMWEPEVRVHGAIAQLWTRYDFHRNGTFSHCGVDAFNLAKTPEGWKITGANWTIERTDCAPSPLGPPKK